MQAGFVGPTVRKGGRFYYTFCDLVAVKAAKDLLAAGMPLQKVRKNVEALKKALPDDTHPASRLRVCCDGETIVALADDVAFEPIGGQVVMAFNVPSFGEHVARGARDAARRSGESDGAPQRSPTTPTEANSGTTAYRCFVEACAAEDRGDSELAEHLFRQAIDLEPNMAAALTNLGNLVYRQGEVEEARRLYERALEHDPTQPEARYNLANLARGPRRDRARDRRATQGLRRGARLRRRALQPRPHARAARRHRAGPASTSSATSSSTRSRLGEPRARVPRAHRVATSL